MSGRLGSVIHSRAPRDDKELLKQLQFQLYQLEIAYRRQGRTAVILLEGWDAAGKGGLIKRMTAELDPRYFKVIPIGAPNEMERRQHYLTRFWVHLPMLGNWTIFDRSWYGRVLVERVEGFATVDEWRRAYDEINSVEATLVAAGTRVIKLFLHVSQEEQDDRLIDRLKQPWKRWKVTAEDFRNRSRRAQYLDAYEDMFEKTDTLHAPWKIIGADHKRAARVEGIAHIIDMLSRDVDLSAPAVDPDIARLAKAAFGSDFTRH